MLFRRLTPTRFCRPIPYAGGVTRSNRPPPPRPELETLIACLHCGGEAASVHRFTSEYPPAFDVPSTRPGGYSIIKGCRFCTSGTMTRVQVQRYLAWKKLRDERKLIR